MLDMQALYTMIIESLRKSEPAYGSPLYMVVGKTGAGKSTLINYLKRVPYTFGDGGVAVPVDPSVKEYAETADRVKAVTTYPAAYKTDEGITLCDCPGFEDNREAERRVAVSVSTEAVVRKSQSIKGLVVVIDYPSLQASRGKGLREVALTIGSLVGGSADQNEQFDPSKSILFVFSKADPRHVKLPYLLKKIDEFISFQEEQLSAIQQKISTASITPAFLKSADHHKVKSPEEEKQEIQLILDILKIMKHNAENLILCDVFDDGQSRTAVFDRMKRLEPIPKEAFNFTDADVVRRDFTDQATVELDRSRNSLNTLGRLPSDIKQITSQKEKLSAELDKYKLERKNLDLGIGATSLGEKDPRFIENKQTLEKNKKRIIELEEKIANNKKEHQTASRELWSLDVGDEMIFEELDFKKGRGDRIGSAVFSPMDVMMTGDVDFADVLIGSVGSLILSPFTLTYGALKRLGHTFEYSGAPYKRVEIKLSNVNEYDVLENDPKNGKYKAHYESDRGRTGKGSVVIWGEKREVLANKAKIVKLKARIEELETEARLLEKEMRAVESTNRQLDDVLSSLKVEGKLNVEKQKFMVENLIDTTSKRVEAVIKEEGTKQQELDSLKSGVKKNEPLLNMLLELSAFLQFDRHKAFPDLIPQFKALYQSYLSGTLSSKPLPPAPLAAKPRAA